MKKITVEEARGLAETASIVNLKPFLSAPDQKLLRDEFMEGENCWVFFRNPEIVVPPQSALKGNWAYAVSKKTGEARHVGDFSHDPAKLHEQLKTMSDYFAQKGS